MDPNIQRENEDRVRASQDRSLLRDLVNEKSMSEFLKGWKFLTILATDCLSRRIVFHWVS